MQQTPVIKSNRITLIKKEEYEVGLEYTDQFFVLHLPYVKKFTKTVYLDMLETLESIEQFASVVGYQDVYAVVFTQDDKMKKFLGKLNFNYVDDYEGMAVFAMKGKV